ICSLLRRPHVPTPFPYTTLFRSWDFDPSLVSCSLTWWHGAHDANAPITAVRRLVALMDGVDLRLWNEAGHLEPYRRHDEIIGERSEEHTSELQSRVDLVCRLLLE